MAGEAEELVECVTAYRQNRDEREVLLKKVREIGARLHEQGGTEAMLTALYAAQELALDSERTGALLDKWFDGLGTDDDPWAA